MRSVSIYPLQSVMRTGNSAASIGHGNPDVLHHALIFVIENVAVEHEVADVALVDSTKKQFRAHGHVLVNAGYLEEDRGSLQGYFGKMLAEIV